jgi:hypothetical protein
MKYNPYFNLEEGVNLISGKKITIDNKFKNDTIALYEDASNHSWVNGLIDTPIGKIRRAGTVLNSSDKIGGYKARWGINRDDYKISPGLYAIGNPNSMSQVLVTANYKLTFDKLRKELGSEHLWIMVIDTKGINVWCAAGKGTFGTKEIINRINKLKLSKVVSHNTIILPQLAAPGVQAHIVTKVTGFKVVYGPVRGSDIHEFLQSGCKATKDMRRVRFNLIDRIVLTPIEICANFKYIPIIYLVFLILNMIDYNKISFGSASYLAVFNSMPYIGAIFIGAFVIPGLLPYIPFRAFSLKGATLGVLWSILVIKFNNIFQYDNSWMIFLSNTLILTSIVTFLSLNFTGSTTYTSLSGVEIETKKTLPIVIIACILGAILMIVGKILKIRGGIL